MIRFSAPAKVHLIGEHAVVYGKPAIISAISLRLTLTLFPTRHPEPTIPVILSAAKNLNKQRSFSRSSPANAVKGPKDDKLSKLQEAVQSAIEKTYKVKIPRYKIQIDSQFPLGSGLGASAAISATLTAALLKLLKIDFRKETYQAEKRQIYNIAIAGERAIHGNPSGSDLAAVTYGGTLWFRKELPSLYLTTPIPLTLPTLFLVDSGRPVESTGEMVAKVAKLDASLKKKTFDQLELLTKGLATDSRNIKQIFKETNACLAKLGVVSKNAQQLIRRIEKLGGAAKITGGGGSRAGSGMILVYHTQPERLKDFELIKIKLNQKGLRPEN